MQNSSDEECPTLRSEARIKVTENLNKLKNEVPTPRLTNSQIEALREIEIRKDYPTAREQEYSQKEAEARRFMTQFVIKNGAEVEGSYASKISSATKNER